MGEKEGSAGKDSDFLNLIEDGSTELSGRHLLEIVIEFHGIREDLASKRLGVSREQVRAWAAELERDGWIEVSDADFGIQGYQITAGGLEKLKGLRRNMQFNRARSEKDSKAKASEKKITPATSFKSTTTFAKSFTGFVKEYNIDLFFFASLLMSGYLLYRFFRQPNSEALSFFFAALVASLILLLFSQYQKYLKSGGLVLGILGLPLWFIRTRKKYIAMIVICIMLVYVGVQIMRFPSERPVYILLFVTLISAGVLVFYTQKTIFDALKFCAGIGLLMYSILLIFGISSVTLLAVGVRYHPLDVFVGVCIITIVQLNERIFGVGVNSLSKILGEI